MKKETKKKVAYDCPEIEIVDVKTDSVICQSVCMGEQEGTGEDCWGNDD